MYCCHFSLQDRVDDVFEHFLSFWNILKTFWQRFWFYFENIE